MSTDSMLIAAVEPADKAARAGRKSARHNPGTASGGTPGGFHAALASAGHPGANPQPGAESATLAAANATPVDRRAGAAADAADTDATSTPIVTDAKLAGEDTRTRRRATPAETAPSDAAAIPANGELVALAAGLPHTVAESEGSASPSGSSPSRSSPSGSSPTEASSSGASTGSPPRGDAPASGASAPGMPPGGARPQAEPSAGKVSDAPAIAAQTGSAPSTPAASGATRSGSAQLAVQPLRSGWPGSPESPESPGSPEPSGAPPAQAAEVGVVVPHATRRAPPEPASGRSGAVPIPASGSAAAPLPAAAASTAGPESQPAARSVAAGAVEATAADAPGSGTSTPADSHRGPGPLSEPGSGRSPQGHAHAVAHAYGRDAGRAEASRGPALGRTGVAARIAETFANGSSPGATAAGALAASHVVSAAAAAATATTEAPGRGPAPSAPPALANASQAGGGDGGALSDGSGDSAGSDASSGFAGGQSGNSGGPAGAYTGATPAGAPHPGAAAAKRAAASFAATLQVGGSAATHVTRPQATAATIEPSGAAAAAALHTSGFAERQAEIASIVAGGPGGDGLPAALAVSGTVPGIGTVAASAPSTVATPAAHAALQMPIGTPDFDRAIGERIAVWLSEGIGRAEITVNPQELGPIRIELSMSGDSASVHLMAAHPETRAALEQSLSSLRDLLAEQGLRLAEGRVGADGGDGQRRFASSAGGEGSQAQPRAPADELPMPPRRQPGAGRLDLFA